MDVQALKKVFGKIYYGGQEAEDLQAKRYKELQEAFFSVFSERELYWFSTPGRTEIGGNHTDHNHGCVLAGSINLDSIAVAAANGLDEVCVYSMGYEDPFVVQLGSLEPDEKEFGTTTSLIRGIAARLKELGHSIGGFNAYLSSDVLPGSGLSSSASIEVLIGHIFSALFNENGISPEVLAMTGQYAENNFFGKPCGLMDQVACAMGGIVTIDFADPSDPKIRQVDFDFAAQDHSLVVVDTGGTHADLTDDYAAVPAEMKSIATLLGAKVSRELTKEQLLKNMPTLREKAGDRAVLRVMHFLGDNERVGRQVDALENGDFKAFLSMVSDSGNSSYKRLQNIYSTVSTEEQGVALGLALSEDFLEEHEAGACRVHGGGFAGTIQVFLPNDLVDDFRERMSPVFGQEAVHVLKIRALGSSCLNELE